MAGSGRNGTSVAKIQTKGLEILKFDKWTKDWTAEQSIRSIWSVWRKPYYCWTTKGKISPARTLSWSSRKTEVVLIRKSSAQR